MNMQEILKDKRVWAVAGVGGIAGLVILFKNKGAGTTDSTSAAGQGIQTGTTGTGTYDSTSSDVANQLGQYQTGLQTALGQYSADQTAALKAYQDQLTGSLSGMTSGTPTIKTVTSLVPVPVKTWKASSKYSADSVARRFGISIDQLQAANPGQNVKAGILKNVSINVPVTSSNTSQFLKG
jgi:LysM repeat protein